jgi:GH24 family phage-related lysozyme (muramidase)
MKKPECYGRWRSKYAHCYPDKCPVLTDCIGHTLAMFSRDMQMKLWDLNWKNNKRLNTW